MSITDTQQILLGQAQMPTTAAPKPSSSLGGNLVNGNLPIAAALLGTHLLQGGLTSFVRNKVGYGMRANERMQLAQAQGAPGAGGGGGGGAGVAGSATAQAATQAQQQAASQLANGAATTAQVRALTDQGMPFDQAVMTAARVNAAGGGAGAMGGGAGAGGAAAGPLAAESEWYRSQGLSPAMSGQMAQASFQQGVPASYAGGTPPLTTSAAGSATGGGGSGAAATLAEEAGAGAGGAATLGRYGQFLESSGLGKLPGVNPAEASLGGAAAYGLGGKLAGSLVDQMNIGGENSRADKGISNAVKGAGYGAAAAMAIGQPELVPFAAVAGAVIDGGLHAIFGNHDSPETQARNAILKTSASIDSLGAQFGISGPALDDIKMQYQVATTSYANNQDWKGAKAYVQSMSSVLPAALIQAKQQQTKVDTYNQRIMQMQNQFAPMFEHILGNVADSNKTMYQAQVFAADELQQFHPELASAIKLNAAGTQQSQDAMMAAYAAQIKISGATASSDPYTAASAQAFSTALGRLTGR